MAVVRFVHPHIGQGSPLLKSRIELFGACIGYFLSAVSLSVLDTNVGEQCETSCDSANCTRV